MKNIIEQIKKLKRIKPYQKKPRDQTNNVWRQIQLKEARQHFEKGLYSEEEYKKKVKEINQKYDSNKPRKN